MDTILAVDDSLLVQAQLQDILQDRYRLVLEGTGPAGIAAAINAPPELILLDINLPGLDGYQVCRELRAHKITSELPIIFLTSCSSVKERVKGFEAGADDYIVKPFYPDELLARINLHLASRREKQMAVELERLKLLREMAVALSHEFNNPLTVIFGFLHLAAKELPQENVAAQEYMAQVRAELEKIRNIVSRLAAASQDVKTAYVLQEEMIDLHEI